MVIFKSMINDENIIPLDNEIQNAFVLASKTIEYDDIIQKLKSNDDKNKAIYILNLNDLKTQNDTNLFLNHLTGYPNDIREACAFKLNEFLNGNIINNTYKLLVENENAINILANAINDINPSICRLVIKTVKKFNNQTVFQNIITKKSLDIINDETISVIKKGYKINKHIFALYWNLEALANLKLTYNDMLKKLVINCANMDEFYTIREKIAKILVLNPDFKDIEIEDIKLKLKSDPNFYVSRFFN